MLTLGLMEGVLSATAGMLVLMIATNENAPLHRVLGPPATVLAGVAAYMIYDSGAAATLGDAVGLLFFAFIALFLPLGVMRTAWKMTKEMDTATPEALRVPVQTPDVVVRNRAA